MKVDFRYEADLSFHRELPNKIQWYFRLVNKQLGLTAIVSKW